MGSAGQGPSSSGTSNARFDPGALIRALDDPESGFAMYMRPSLAEAEANGGLSGDAQELLRQGINCILVGRDREADALLNRAYDWVSRAIAKGETQPKYDPRAYTAQMHYDRAMCTWLLHDQHDASDLGAYTQNHWISLNRRWTGAIPRASHSLCRSS